MDQHWLRQHGRCHRPGHRNQLGHRREIHKHRGQCCGSRRPHRFPRLAGIRDTPALQQLSCQELLRVGAVDGKRHVHDPSNFLLRFLRRGTTTSELHVGNRHGCHQQPHIYQPASCTVRGGHDECGEWHNLSLPRARSVDVHPIRVGHHGAADRCNSSHLLVYLFYGPLGVGRRIQVPHKGQAELWCRSVHYCQVWCMVPTSRIVLWKHIQAIRGPPNPHMVLPNNQKPFPKPG